MRQIKPVYQEFGGGIHPPVDDMPGRLIGEKIGIKAFEQAQLYYLGQKN